MTRIAFATLALAFCFAGPAVAQGNTLVYVGSVVSEQENLWEYNPGGRDYVLPSNRSRSTRGRSSSASPPNSRLSSRSSAPWTKRRRSPGPTGWIRTRRTAGCPRSRSTWVGAVRPSRGVQMGCAVRWRPVSGMVRALQLRAVEFCGAVDLRGRGNMAAAPEVAFRWRHRDHGADIPLDDTLRRGRGRTPAAPASAAQVLDHRQIPGRGRPTRCTTSLGAPRCAPTSWMNFQTSPSSRRETHD